MQQDIGSSEMVDGRGEKDRLAFMHVFAGLGLSFYISGVLTDAWYTWAVSVLPCV
jgi:hypothetical protein